MADVDFLVHAPPGSPPWVMAEAFAAAVAASGADERRWRLVDCGSEPGVAAMRELARRAGDGNVISTCTPVFIQAPLLGKIATTHRALTPLARLVGDRYLLVVRADAPYAGATDLLGVIRKGATRSGGYFAGGINHLLALAIAEAAGGAVEFVKVASEADLFPALLDGRIDWAVATPVEIRTRAPAGQIRVLAALATEQVPAFPDAPTLASCGAPVDFSLWRGLAAPGGISPDALAGWDRIIRAAIATPSWHRYLTDNGQTASHLGAEQFTRFLDSEWNWYERHMGRACVLPKS
jgi:putative tricarboxylic transport membrane protein